MAHIDGDLWRFNLVHVVWLDTTDDRLLMREPLPNACYPVLGEGWIATVALPGGFESVAPVSGYRYQWHDHEDDIWYVGLAKQSVA